jgi:hydrogenase-4 component F
VTVLVGTLIAIPAALAVLCLVVPSRLGAPLTALGGLCSAGCIVAIALASASGAASPDALSALFLLPVAIVYGSVGLYTHWYIQAESSPGERGEPFRREFLSLTNAFAGSEIVVPLLTNMAGLWVALEVTTILSALLIRLQGNSAALEAAWKYILIASCGLAFGLVAVVLLYAAGVGPLGTHYSPQWSAYVASAARLDPDTVRVAFILALVGFGTKVGFAPMHAWLPDAHGAGPTPTSAMLSGALLSDALYALLRFAAISNAVNGPGLTHGLFFVVGLISLFIAAFFLLQQRDIKRMLAYSSIEHMGVVALGLAFGAPLAVMGALLHAINHAASKSLAFFAAGRLSQRYGTRELAGIRGGIVALPVSGTLFAIAGLSLVGLPPFGIFRSELMILAGGFGTRGWVAAAVAVLLLGVAFAGMLRWVQSASAGEPGPGIAVGERGSPAVYAMLLLLIIVLGVGLFVPTPLNVLRDRSMTSLRQGP